MLSHSPSRELLIVGGTYREHCLHPAWREVFGSGGRAASAAAALAVRTRLLCYADDAAHRVLEARSALEGFSFQPRTVDESVSFYYDHGLATPRILGVGQKQPTMHVDAECVLRFGMLEGDAVVNAGRAVYDPQDAVSPQPFAANGSQARQLAVVLNRREAELLVGQRADTHELAKDVLTQSGAAAVVIKRGGLGAVTLENGDRSEIPAYLSDRVWKIGSGDNFATHFAVRWMLQGKSAADSADLASQATSYYCETQGFPDEAALRLYDAEPVRMSQRFLAGYVPRVYLAGPFFNLAQLWLVSQAQRDLQTCGLRVFSPYLDVGIGSAEAVVEADLEGIKRSDLVFAVADGMDAGTVFEIGYARAIGKPVVVYSENESKEDRKMMDGTDCLLVSDYVSAIYRTLWTASAL